MNQQIKLDDFDDYMVLEVIFQHLDLIELLKCRLVSKKWKNLIDKIKIRELIVSKSTPMGIRRYCWYHSNRLIYYKNSFHSLNLFSMNVPMFQNLTKNLKYLNITFDLIQNDQQFNISHLNNFKQLEHLNLCCIEMKESVKLVLPELRILCFDELQDMLSPLFEIFNSNILTVDSPKLEILFLNYIEKFELVHYESVKRLQIGSSFIDEQFLNSFTNLEYLQCDHFQLLSANALNYLPNLKELNCNYKSSLLMFGENFKEMIKNLLEQKFNGLKINFLGIQLRDDCFNFESNLNDPIDLHVKNYENLCNNLNWFNAFNYSRFMELTNNQMPNDLFKKYTNIQIVIANKIVNQIHFINFLKNCKKLSKLTISNSSLNVSLDQAFYDQLGSFTSLIELTIRDTNNIQINFEFILHLQQLHYFQTTNEMTTDLVLKSIKQNNYLSLICFENCGNVYLIQKNEQNNFDLAYMKSIKELRYKSMADKTEMSFDELVEMVKSLPNHCIAI